MKSNELSITLATLAEILDAVLSKKASLRFKVHGFSMLPFIRDEDIVTVSPVLNSNLRLGSPVVFTQPQTEKIVVHRIIGKNGDGYFIKGDSVFEVDGLIPRGRILALVTNVERENKRVIFGLGPERLIIILLSKIRFFYLMFWCWGRFPLSLRRYLRRFV